jgi:lipopolysaccharide assembly protein A
MATEAPRDQPSPEKPASRAFKIPPKAAVAALILVAAIWFIVANNGKARITFWLTDVRAPMWIVLLGTFVAGLVTGRLTERRRRR